MNTTELTQIASTIRGKFALQICQAWNELNADLLDSILADNLEYTSFWVFETLEGKDVYLDYLRGKFNAVKNTGIDSQVKAEVRYINDKFQPVIIQGDEELFLHMSIENNLITSLCMMPMPEY